MISVPELRTDRTPDFEPHPCHFEHAALRVSARRLESLLGSMARGRPERRETVIAQSLLATFRLRLFDHLTSEEGNRVLERAAAMEPRFGRRIERLRRQHAELRDHLDALVVEASRADWTRTHVGFVAFHRALRMHDQVENDVLQRTYLEDSGGGD